MTDKDNNQPKRPVVHTVVMETLSQRPDGSWRVVKRVVVKSND